MRNEQTEPGKETAPRPSHSRENPADTETRRWLDVQKAMAEGRSARKSTRMADRILLSLCALMLSVCGLLIYILPSHTFSEAENRPLTVAPRFTFHSLFSGQFTSAVTDFYADQFPWRNAFVEVKAMTELAALRLENNDVMLGRDGYIVKRLEYDEAAYETIRKNMDALESFRRFCEKNGTACTLAVVPRGEDVLKSKLLSTYDGVRAAQSWQDVEGRTETFTERLRTLADDGAYVWYKTDHHYTALGAYYVYEALGASLGYTPRPLSDFTMEYASDGFYGTTYSSSGMRWVAPDTLTFFRYEGDERFYTSFSSGGEGFDGFYDRSYLAARDQYSAYLGGNHALTRVTCPGETRPKLMLVKDSFAHALAPFLAQHFDLVLVDLRYYTSSVRRLWEAEQPDAVLVLYGLDSLATSDEASRVAYGLN